MKLLGHEVLEKDPRITANSGPTGWSWIVDGSSLRWRKSVEEHIEPVGTTTCFCTVSSACHVAVCCRRSGRTTGKVVATIALISIFSSGVRIAFPNTEINA